MKCYIICAKMFIFLIQGGDEFKMAATVLDEFFEKYIHQSELNMLAHYPPVKEVIKVGLHFMKNFRTYMDKKMTLLQE